MTFDDFVQSPINELAFNTCREIAETVGQYNPVYLHGGTGQGKTHLLKAIEHKVASSRSLKYIQGFEFVSEMITAVKSGELDIWRVDLYEHAYVLLDDIGSIMASEQAQHEFYLLVESMLTAAGKQLVVTADRRPRDFEDISDRLISRLSRGIMAEVGVLLDEQRTQILKQELVKHGITLDASTMDYLIVNLPGQARELQGAVVQLAAHVRMTGANPNKDMVSKVLRDVMTLPKVQKRINVEDIMEHVCRFYRIRMQDMIGPRRMKSLAGPRHVAIYLAKELTQLTLSEIGSLFGGRDHSTVLHAVNKIKMNRLDSNILRNEIDALSVELESTVVV